MSAQNRDVLKCLRLRVSSLRANSWSSPRPHDPARGRDGRPPERGHAPGRRSATRIADAVPRCRTAAPAGGSPGKPCESCSVAAPERTPVSPPGAPCDLSHSCIRSLLVRRLNVINR